MPPRQIADRMHGPGLHRDSKETYPCSSSRTEVIHHPSSSEREDLLSRMTVDPSWNSIGDQLFSYTHLIGNVGGGITVRC